MALTKLSVWIFSSIILKDVDFLIWYTRWIISVTSHSIFYESLSFHGREIRVWTFPIASKIDRNVGSSAALTPGRLQSDTIIVTSNLAASRLHTGFDGKTYNRLVNRGPGSYFVVSHGSQCCRCQWTLVLSDSWPSLIYSYYLSFGAVKFENM